MKQFSKPSKRVQAVAGGALATAVAVGAFSGLPAGASSEPQQAPAQAEQAGQVGKDSLRQTAHLTVDAATEAAQAALQAAAEEDQNVSVAVVDRDGNTILTMRGDGAGPQSYEAAEKKAFTAVSWNAPTSELTGRLDQAPTLKDIPGTLFLAGGAPVTAGDAPIAGIGVAGAPSGDLDETFAEAGADALAQ